MQIKHGVNRRSKGTGFLRHQRTLFVGAVCCLGFFMLSQVACGAETDSETTQLLQLVRSLRQATLSAFPQGSGVAAVTANDEGAKESYFANFQFAGNDSLAQFSPDSSFHKIIDKFLWKGDIQIRYLLPGGPPVSSVTIDTREFGRAMSFDLDGWSYADFMAVPVGCPPSEDTLFDLLLTSAQHLVRIVRAGGSRVVMTVTAPADPRHIVAAEKWIVTFDMSCGGAMTTCEHDVIHTNSPSPYLSERVDNDWMMDTEGRIMPKRHHLLSVMHKENSPEQMIERTIEFQKVEAREIDVSSLTFKTLNVPSGTPVVDNVHHVEWRQDSFGTDLPSDDSLLAGLKRGQASEFSDNASEVAKRLSNPKVVVGDDSGISFWRVASEAGAFILTAVVIYIILRRKRRIRGHSGPVSIIVVIACLPTLSLNSCNKSGRGTVFVVTPKSLNFGHMKADQQAIGTVQVVNRSTERVKVLATPTCGCTTSDLTRDVLAPGESTSLKVTFHSGGYAHSVHKVVALFFNGATIQQTIALPVDAYVDVGVTITPPIIDLGSGIPGQTLHGHLLIDADRREDLSGVNVRGPGVTAYKIDALRFTLGMWEAEVRFDWVIKNEYKNDPIENKIVIDTAAKDIPIQVLYSILSGVSTSPRVIEVGKGFPLDYSVTIYGAALNDRIRCRSLYSGVRPSEARRENGNWRINIAIEDNILRKVGFDALEIMIVPNSGNAKQLIVPVIIRDVAK